MIRRPPRSTLFPTRRSSDLKSSPDIKDKPFGKQFDELFADRLREDRKSTRLNSSHGYISYAVFCLKKKKQRAKRAPLCAAAAALRLSRLPSQSSRSSPAPRH